MEGPGGSALLYTVSGSHGRALSVECGEGIKGESCYILPQVNGHFSSVSSLTIIRGVIKFAADREGRGGVEWELFFFAVDSILELRYEIKVNGGRERVWMGNEVKNTGPIVLTAEAEQSTKKGRIRYR